MSTVTAPASSPEASRRHTAGMHGPPARARRSLSIASAGMCRADARDRGPLDPAAWLERHGRAVMGTYGTPLRTLVRGEGAQVWDADGRRYVDLLAGIATSVLGHAHPLLTAAVTSHQKDGSAASQAIAPAVPSWQTTNQVRRDQRGPIAA